MLTQSGNVLRPTPTTKVDLAVPQSSNTPSDIDTPRKPVQVVSRLSTPFPQQYVDVTIINEKKALPLT